MRPTRIVGLACTVVSLSACGGASAPPTTATAASPPEPQPAPAATAVATAAAPSSQGGVPSLGATVPSKPAPIVKSTYGKLDGKDIDLYTLTNASGLVLKVTPYGTIITELWVPDRNGKSADIVLGFENLDGYVKKTPYFGATVGRIANRIKNAEFKLEGKTYKLAANNGPHSLHGGTKGWDKVVWDAEPIESPNGPSIKFTYVSKDGEEGFPGTIKATTIYTLTNQNELKVEMGATTDKTSIINMAHHTYWNLGGYNAGTIVDHELTIYADKYTPSAPVPKGDPVPDGSVKPVKDTPFDFTKPKPIGKDLQAVGGTPIGYDHNWIVNGDPHAIRPVARVKDPKSGRVLTLEADQPGVQFYSGKFLDGTITGKGTTYAQYTGFCLETQEFPNAINVPAWKSQVILKPGQTYKHVMIHRFTTE